MYECKVHYGQNTLSLNLGYFKCATNLSECTSISFGFVSVFKIFFSHLLFLFLKCCRYLLLLHLLEWSWPLPYPSLPSTHKHTPYLHFFPMLLLSAYSSFVIIHLPVICLSFSPGEMVQGELSPQPELTVLPAAGLSWCCWEDHSVGRGERHSSLWDPGTCQTHPGWELDCTAGHQLLVFLIEAPQWRFTLKGF